jgi:hypothetical protein
MNKIKIPVEYTSSDPNLIRHSDEMQDIITAVPSKLIRWGMFLFLGVFVIIVGFAAFIHFPDIVDTTIKINNNLTVEMLVPQTVAAKVQAGQEVLINFRGDRHSPYKMLKGKIADIADTLDNNGNFRVHISIENESNSSYLKSGMRGDARIMINDFSILKHLFRNFFQ